jgi:hypothetical protein
MRDKMWLRVRLALAVLFAAVLGAGGLANPAQAAFGGTCATNAFCLYQWTGLGAQVAGDRWQSSYTNIIVNHGGCLNLGSATWDNGTPVNDNTGSAMVNTGSNGGAYTQYAVTLFNWTNCNTSGQWKVIGYLGDNTSYALDNFNNYLYNNSSISLYHTVTSIGIRCVIC